MVLQYIVQCNSISVKEILKEHFNISDRLILKLKRNNKIFVNDICVPVNYVAVADDVVTVLMDFVEDNSNIVPTKMELDILYEDDALLIVNKPANVAVHPSRVAFFRYLI